MARASGLMMVSPASSASACWRASSSSESMDPRGVGLTPAPDSFWFALSVRQNALLGSRSSTVEFFMMAPAVTLGSASKVAGDPWPRYADNV